MSVVKGRSKRKSFRWFNAGLAAVAVSTVLGVGYGSYSLVVWLLEPDPVIIGKDGEAPKLNTDQVKQLSGESRKEALQRYGKALADSHIARRENREPREERKRDSAENPGEAARPGSQNRDSVRKTMENLSEEDRRAAMQGMRKTMMEERTKEIDEFFKLSAEEQKAELDKRIDEMEQRMKEREKRRETAAKNGETRERPERPARNNDPDRRNEFFRNILDETTPEDRAKSQAYMTALKARAEERGVTLNGGMGRR
jgi:hypothetical protein